MCQLEPLKEGGLHTEQTRRGAISVTIEAARKRKYCKPMEFQDREGRNDSLKLELENYLKKRRRRQKASCHLLEILLTLKVLLVYVFHHITRLQGFPLCP